MSWGDYQKAMTDTIQANFLERAFKDGFTKIDDIGGFETHLINGHTHKQEPSLKEQMEKRVKLVQQIKTNKQIAKRFRRQLAWARQQEHATIEFEDYVFDVSWGYEILREAKRSRKDRAKRGRR